MSIYRFSSFQERKKNIYAAFANSDDFFLIKAVLKTM